MPRLMSDRLTQQLQRVTEVSAYSAIAYYYDAPNPDENLDQYGHPTEVVKPIKVECSVNDMIGRRRAEEAWTEGIEIGKFDAEIRFGPTEFVPKKGGKFKITQNQDNPEFIDEEFEIIGIQNRGNFGFLCALRRVTT